MSSQVDINGLKNKKLCFDCVGETFLKNEMQAAGKVAKCSYCGARLRSYTIGAMAERIAEVFNEHYTRTPDQPDSFQQMMLSDREASADDDSEGLFDETEQARLILARYDARQAPTPLKRRRKAKTAAAGKDDAGKAGLGDAYAQGLVEGQGLGNRSTGDGQGKAAEAGSSPDQLDELEREL